MKSTRIKPRMMKSTLSITGSVTRRLRSARSNARHRKHPFPRASAASTGVDGISSTMKRAPNLRSVGQMVVLRLICQTTAPSFRRLPRRASHRTTRVRRPTEVTIIHRRQSLKTPPRLALTTSLLVVLIRFASISCLACSIIDERMSALKLRAQTPINVDRILDKKAARHRTIVRVTHPDKQRATRTTMDLGSNNSSNFSRCHRRRHPRRVRRRRAPSSAQAVDTLAKINSRLHSKMILKHTFLKFSLCKMRRNQIRCLNVLVRLDRLRRFRKPGLESQNYRRNSARTAIPTRLKLANQ